MKLRSNRQPLKRRSRVHFPEVGRTGLEVVPRPRPVRTCVGCRERATKSELLRVVLARDKAVDAGETTGPPRPEGSDSPTPVVADPKGVEQGRGAYLHPTTRCLAQAERRRAFSRALRAEGPLDLEPLRRYVERLDTG